MTPKEEAIELSMKFDKYGETDNAKQCALIAVNEILYILEFKLDYKMLKSIEYWQQVKTEIQNL